MDEVLDTAPVLTWAQRRSDQDEDAIGNKFAEWDEWVSAQSQASLAEVARIAEFTHFFHFDSNVFINSTRQESHPDIAVTTCLPNLSLADNATTDRPVAAPSSLAGQDVG